MAEPRICLAAVVGAHGVRGLVRLKPFTEQPESVVAYGPLSDESGARRFALRLKGRVKDLLLAEIEGIRDREAAQALRGLRLYVPREALPPPEDPEEFYYADLVGLAVEDPEGSAFGRVTAVRDFGAGDLLEVQAPKGESFFLPFTREVVPEVDLAGRRLVAVLPDEVTAGPEKKDLGDAEASLGSGQGRPDKS